MQKQLNLNILVDVHKLEMSSVLRMKILKKCLYYSKHIVFVKYDILAGRLQWTHRETFLSCDTL